MKTRQKGMNADKGQAYSCTQVRMNLENKIKLLNEVNCQEHTQSFPSNDI